MTQKQKPFNHHPRTKRELALADYWYLRGRREVLIEVSDAFKRGLKSKVVIKMKGKRHE